MIYGIIDCFCFVLFCPIMLAIDDSKAEEKAQSFGKHLSKSASELDSRENYAIPSQSSPSPQRSGRSVAGVLQRTHGFLSTLKVKKKYNFSFLNVSELSRKYKNKKILSFLFCSIDGHVAEAKKEAIVFIIMMVKRAHMKVKALIMRLIIVPIIVAHHVINHHTMVIHR